MSFVSPDKEETSSLPRTIEIVARSTASLSGLSSILIIYVIFASRNGLSTSYHRILFGMSVFDLLTSTAIALTTLPMPRDYEDEGGFSWTGKIIGNDATCAAQGYFVYSIAGAISYNAMLGVYYFHIIGIQKEFNIKLEYALHVLVWLIGTCPALVPLTNNHFYPNRYLPWCGLVSSQAKVFNLVVLVFSVCTLIVCVASLLFVSFKVVKRNKEIIESIRNFPELDHKLQKIRRETHIVLVQSFSYLMALTATLVTSIIPRHLSGERDEWYFLAVVTLLPLQGFFDFLIFVGSKVVILRSVEPGLTIFGALNKLFCHRTYDPVLLSHLSLVRQDLDSRDDDIDVALEDEFGIRRIGDVINPDESIRNVLSIELSVQDDRNQSLGNQSLGNQSLGGFENQNS